MCRYGSLIIINPCGFHWPIFGGLSCKVELNRRKRATCLEKQSFNKRALRANVIFEICKSIFCSPEYEFVYLILPIIL